LGRSARPHGWQAAATRAQNRDHVQRLGLVLHFARSSSGLGGLIATFVGINLVGLLAHNLLGA